MDLVVTVPICGLCHNWHHCLVKILNTSYEPLATTEEPSAPVMYFIIDSITARKSDPTFYTKVHIPCVEPNSLNAAVPAKGQHQLQTVSVKLSSTDLTDEHQFGILCPNLVSKPNILVTSTSNRVTLIKLPKIPRLSNSPNYYNLFSGTHLRGNKFPIWWAKVTQIGKSTHNRTKPTQQKEALGLTREGSTGGVGVVVVQP
ncbi:hypothetical protein DSO57_1023925 [Entomophthora muscae]|uniref:Uncharacterized protein n=1 Tax=Entomophthora muscae TaxID=34485 RepID=A0ACC2SRR2_9FUNG|nr:hypothetical protein DSO57_1023925 [Entomophthora muscae]